MPLYLAGWRLQAPLYRQATPCSSQVAFPRTVTCSIPRARERLQREKCSSLLTARHVLRCSLFPLPCSAAQRHIAGPTLTGWESHWEVGSSGLLNGLPATETVSVFVNPQWGLMVLGRASCLEKESRDPAEEREPGLSRIGGKVFLCLVPLGKLWLFQTCALEASSLPEPIVPCCHCSCHQSCF